MLILRIRRAECALTGGRLDEAFELAIAEDLRSHRRGQDLISSLADAFVKRSREHLAAQRPTQALADCRKAAKLMGNTPETSSLQADITEAMNQQLGDGQRQGQILAEARQHMDKGQLSAGGRILADADRDAPAATALTEELARRREAAEAAGDKVQAALDRNDYSRAVDELVAARSARLTSDRIITLTGRLAELMAGRIGEHLNAGRLDLAENLMTRLGLLAADTLETQELTGVLNLCRQAGSYVRDGQPLHAARVFRKLGAMLPEAKWIQTAISNCDSAVGAMEVLHTGPVGLLGKVSSDILNVASQTQMNPPPATGGVKLPEPLAAATLPGKFLIQADGVGSFLVVRGPVVTIGPISSPECPAVGLLADPSSPVASIERTDEDYFLRCDRTVTVNDRAVTERLLADGDKVALSPRCRWRFVRPNAASNSAMLTLSGARLPQADTRKVILLDREIIIGPGPTAHIRADRCGHTAVLHVSNDRLMCRSEMPLTLDGKTVDPSQGIPMDTPVKIGQIRLVVTSV